MSNLYNLLAEIISKLKQYPSGYEPDMLTKEAEETLTNEVISLLGRWKNKLNNSAIIGLSSDAYNDIIAWANNHKNYHSYRTLLCTIDSSAYIGLKQEACKKREKKFVSLNDNTEETGILVLPKIHRPPTTYIRPASKDRPEETVARKNANEWADSLNSRLNNIYYICTNELNGFYVWNYVCDFTFEDPSSNEIKIGVSPILNLKLKQVLSYDDTIRCKNESGMECQYFDVKEVIVQKTILERVQECFKLACEQHVDILMFPEMLGIDDLYNLDCYDFNPVMRELSRQVQGDFPYLTLMPSIWRNNQNYVNVHLSSARRLCTQYKQHKYTFPGSQGNATENLKNIPKEVSLIHVPGWGRIAIPICIDFLHPEYRDWLVTTLKADILLCPSYSPGEYNFLQSLDSNAGYGVHVVWLNSCSALRNSQTGAPELIGAACAPSVSSESRITRFIPECEGACTKGCLFVVTLPLNCMGESFYEERRVQVKHVRAPKAM